MVNNNKHSAKSEDIVEQYLKEQNINYIKEPLVGRFKPDFLIDDSILVEVKYFKVLSATSNTIISSIATKQILLEKLYQKKFSTICIVNSEQNKYALSTLLHFNLVYDLFLHISDIKHLNKYLQGKLDKEQFFFDILDKRSDVIQAYRYILYNKKYAYKTVLDFFKHQQIAFGSYGKILKELSHLAQLGILKKIKKGKYTSYKPIDSDWRYIAYSFFFGGIFELNSENWILLKTNVKKQFKQENGNK